MRFVSAVNRGFQRALDAVLRIDGRGVLNADTAERTGGTEIAAELLMAVRMIQAEAVSTDGGLDYDRLRESGVYQAFRTCTGRLVGFDPVDLSSPTERLAFWINLYNALIIDAVISFGIRGSIREDLGFFRRAAYLVGGRRYSADDIEHGILRGNRRHFHPAIPFSQFAPDDPRLRYSLPSVDPRIHSALVCASRSCPPLASFDGERIDQQLDAAARNFVNGGAVVVEPGHNELRLSPIFRWYKRDFDDADGIAAFILLYLDDGVARDALQSPRRRLRYQTYDWSLNGV